ncbi:CCR4-NOT transcription complex subunit 2 [Phytophthora pseudosyringae]|uniref:CCR4-NOT transcription complex subunit 2 n=1 Tax=Phytophthora pseudosyringae TaxID=221518 RepID=A0A8T1W6T7_9STRA|nr:CCR4-NOT transcription complex subunit 2 [Phytophthora pseudosyringae]
MIDPSKDKFAYFKDNIQTAEDKEEFDASQYYYHRDEFSSPKELSASNGLGGSGGPHLSLSAFHAMGSGGLGVMDADVAVDPIPLAQLHGSYSGSGYSSSLMQGGSSSFLGGSGVGRMQLGGGAMPPSHELHRINSGRNFQLTAENKAPDMSEFPALGSRMGSLSLDSSFEGSATDRMRAQPSEFVIQKEDFPALSTFGPGAGEKSPLRPPTELKRHSSFTSSAADGMLSSRLEQQKGGTSIGSRAGSLAQAAGAGSSGSVNLGTEAFDHFRAPRQDEQAATVEASNGELDPSNQYGLLGMLHTVIRPGNDSKKNLAMGCDLTSLGLNLNSAESLYPTFASPWSEEQLTKEPQFSLPMCYYNQPPVLKTTHLSKFHLETLFFIFYSMPKDVLQAYAAQELYSREWRYHAELKTWLKRASPADAALLTGNASSSVGGSSSGSPTGATGNGSIGSIGSAMGSSTGPSLANSSMAPQFLYFDTATWERRVFTGNINSISAGLLGEEEIRVKFNASS